jgi:hypothetical protein
MHELKEFLGSWSLILSFVFFVVVQIAVVHGLHRFLQLHCDGQQFADELRTSAGMEITSVSLFQFVNGLRSMNRIISTSVN